MGVEGVHDADKVSIIDSSVLASGDAKMQDFAQAQAGAQAQAHAAMLSDGAGISLRDNVVAADVPGTIQYIN